MQINVHADHKTVTIDGDGPDSGEFQIAFYDYPTETMGVWAPESMITVWQLVPTEIDREYTAHVVDRLATPATV